ncbi:MAG: hypothetical protein J6R67_11105 [Treponema sp.]|nr:hypothetical protein [Treponema sp.]
MKEKIIFTRIIPTCLLFIICIFLACEHQSELKNPEPTLSNPPSHGGNLGKDNVPDIVSPSNPPSHGGNLGQDNVPDTVSPSNPPSHSEDTEEGNNSNAPESPRSIALEDYKYYKNLEITETNLKNALWGHTNLNYVFHLMKILRDEIVPQATNALLNRFPKTFIHLKDQVIGMGLALNTNESSTAKAIFEMGYMYGNESPYKTMDIRYTLIVNYSNFQWEENKLQDFWRQELEVTVAHEMMHAFMCETLTRGFTGLEHNLSHQTTDKFPSWFIEGTAEAVCGAIDTIRHENGYGINQNTALNEIQEKLSSNKYSLTSDEITATYKTGYLAVLYLSYLAHGSNSLEAQDLAEGLDTLLSRIHSGQSLSDTIVEISSNKFSSLQDFEDNFAAEGAPFVKKLIEQIGTVGRGALLTGNYNDRDLLQDEPLSPPSTLFWLNVASYSYFNKYKDKFTTFDVLKGGSATQSGIPGPRPYEKLTEPLNHSL